MKTLFAVAAFAALAGCSSPTAPRPHPDGYIVNLGDQVGDPCTVGGRSGYIVYAGDKLICDTSGRGG